MLFVICVLILIGVSLATAPPPEYKIAGLTYGTAEQDLLAEPPSAGDEVRPAQEEEGAVQTTTEKREEPEQPLELTERPEWRRQDLLLTVGVIIAVGLVWLLFSPIVL